MLVLLGSASKSRESMSRSLLFKLGPDEEAPSLPPKSDLLSELLGLRPPAPVPFLPGGLMPLSEPLSEDGEPPVFLSAKPLGEPVPDGNPDDEDEADESWPFRFEADPAKSPGLWDLDPYCL